MSRNRFSVLPILIAVTGLLLIQGCFLFPPKMRYVSTLTPRVPDNSNLYTVQPDGTVSYNVEGSRIDVRYMTDEELNALFPKESSRGKYSINPYTYGNWVDPDLGYIPNRFTVFKVTVYNYTFAKVSLDPLKALLLTDKGDRLYAYGIEGPVPHNSFEKYYMALRRQSGNEYYRYNMRMGIVRSHNYARDQVIFKGESYGGFIVFDPLDGDVKRVRLILKDFVTKFDQFGAPLEKRDIIFDFTRSVELKSLEPSSGASGD